MTPVLAIALGLSGCATTSTAPSGWLPPAELAGRNVYGGWVELRPVDRHVPLPSGELIAVAPDSLWVLPPDGGLVTVPRDAVRRARVTLYDAALPRANGWVVAGGLAALTNGFLAMITLPAWIVGGNAAAHAHAAAARLRYPEDPWSALGAGARFPAGMPPGLTRAILSGRPLAEETTAPARAAGAERVPE